MSVVLQTEVRRHRLTVDDFHRMGEAGIRDSQGPRHRGAYGTLGLSPLTCCA
jgi:hypothetical protein